jgi:probable addiction module antidote protein
MRGFLASIRLSQEPSGAPCLLACSTTELAPMMSSRLSALARDTDISREALYKAFSDNGNPTLDTLLRVMKALGVRLAVAA